MHQTVVTCGGQERTKSAGSSPWAALLRGAGGTPQPVTPERGQRGWPSQQQGPLFKPSSQTCWCRECWPQSSDHARHIDGRRGRQLSKPALCCTDVPSKALRAALAWRQSNASHGRNDGDATPTTPLKCAGATVGWKSCEEQAERLPSQRQVRKQEQGRDHVPAVLGNILSDELHVPRWSRRTRSCIPYQRCHFGILCLLSCSTNFSHRWVN